MPGRHPQGADRVINMMLLAHVHVEEKGSYQFKNLYHYKNLQRVSLRMKKQTREFC